MAKPTVSIEEFNLWRVQGWFDPVLVSVNGLKSLTSNSRLLLLRFRLPGLSGSWHHTADVEDFLNEKDFREAGQTLRPILSALVESGGATKKIWKQLAELVGYVELSGDTSLGRDPGEFLTIGTANVTRLTQWLALLVADLIHRELDSRLRICELPSCSDFFVAWKTRGPMQRYCSRSHGSQHRVQRKRKADQRRRLS